MASASFKLEAKVKIAKPVVATDSNSIESNDFAIVLVTDETGFISKKAFLVRDE
jgi:hypothetical protein